MNHDAFKPAVLEALASSGLLGAGHEGTLLHPESPIEWMYYPAAPADRRHTCAIIARVVADGVRFVTVRRDPRV